MMTYIHRECFFQPVDVWTKCGHRGRVKEPVGTHGKLFLNWPLTRARGHTKKKKTDLI